MIQAYEGSRLRQAVSLNHRISQAMPEFFRVAVERRAAADHRPEFPSKLTADIAEGPPAAEKVLTRAGRVEPSKPLALSAVVKIAFDLLLQRLDHARHSAQHRNPLAAGRRHHFGRNERVLENRSPAQQRRQKAPQEL